MDQAVVRGAFGYHARRDAPSLVLQSFGRTAEAGENENSPPGSTDDDDDYPQSGIMREFSSPSLPIVTMKGDGRYKQITIDPAKTDPNNAIDVVVGGPMLDNWSYPRNEVSSIHEISTCVMVPYSKLHFDVLLHESMARQCLASLKVYHTVPGIFVNRTDHWYDELAYPTTLQLIDTKSRNMVSRFLPRYGEMVSTFFSRIGWPIEEFACYRCEVEYPVWCGYYCMIFDYSKPALP